MLNPKIVQAVAVTAELTGSTLSEVAMTAMVEHLSAYETEAVLAALHRCQLELRGALTLGAIVDRLDDGHLGPETAWAMVGALREEDSVVWTDEIAQAFGVARPIMADHVAARLAFLETYRRLLGEARAERRAPAWWASLGYDMAGRVDALTRAVEQQRLSAREARRMLPPHTWPPIIVPSGPPALPAENTT